MGESDKDFQGPVFLLPEGFSVSGNVVPGYVLDSVIRMKRLATVMLENALMETQCLTSRGRLDRERAYLWIRSEDESYPWTFVNVCRFLEMDPGLVRTRVLGNLVDFESIRFREKVVKPSKEIRAPKKRVRKSHAQEDRGQLSTPPTECKRISTGRFLRSVPEDVVTRLRSNGFPFTEALNAAVLRYFAKHSKWPNLPMKGKLFPRAARLSRKEKQQLYSRWYEYLNFGPEFWRRRHANRLASKAVNGSLNEFRSKRADKERLRRAKKWGEKLGLTTEEVLNLWRSGVQLRARFVRELMDRRREEKIPKVGQGE